MAKNLKGITIKIGADVKDLNSALKDVDKQVYDLNGDLKNLEKALKLDPKNTEILAQKQDVLKRNIQATTERLNTLKEAQKQMGDYSKLTDEQKTKYNALTQEIAKAENALKNMNSQLKQTNQIDLSKITSALKKVGQVALQVVKKVLQIGTAIAGAIAGVIAAGVKEYAEYEQQLGGIEALFGKNKKALQEVQKTGTTAWKNLTLSTSDYYREFTKTYTLVKNSIPSTEKAIKTTNRMIQLESDLSNTFGYDITTASNAINWALKGSFNYIDNLNLGIKGTKTGFLEAAKNCGYLVNSVDELTSDQILDVLEQYAKKFGVLGRTEKEAADTIQGSLKSLKATWSNFIAGVGTPEELSSALQNFLKNVVNTIKKLAPSIINGLLDLIKDLVPKFIKGLIDTLPQLIEATTSMLNDICKSLSENTEALTTMAFTIINNLIKFLNENIPLLLNVTLEMIKALGKGLQENLPILITSVLEIIYSIVAWFLDNIDIIVNLGLDIIQALQEGMIVKGIPMLVEKLPIIIIKFVSAIIKSLPQILSIGVRVIETLTKGIISGVKNFPDMVKRIIKSVKEEFNNKLEEIKNIGADILKGIIQGIKNAPEKIWNGLGDIKNKLLKKVKSIFKIASPSKVMADEVGFYLGTGINKGLVEGIEETNFKVKDALTSLGSGISASVNPTINPTANTNPLILQIENFYNNRDTDIQRLAEELEFYRKRSATAKGGN